MEPPDPDYQAGESLLVAGRYRAALSHFSRLLLKHPSDERAYQAAARALLASFDEENSQDHMDPSERAALYRGLILQEHCNRSPPVLHQLIVNQHTSHTRQLIPRVAQNLGPALRSFLDEGMITKNLVVLLLILRESLNQWITQREISTYHLGWLHEFSLPDLSLPYRSILDMLPYKRNRADILRHLSAHPESVDSTGPFSLFHVVLFEWLSGSALIKGERHLNDLLTARLAPGVTQSESLAAAKSLIVRHYPGVYPGIGAEFQKFGMDASFEELVLSAAEIRARLEKSCSGIRQSIGARTFYNRGWQGFQAAKNMLMGRIPFITRLSRRPKVAICVSGQLRGYRTAFASWRRTLLQTIDYELFIHSWAIVGRSGAEPFRYVLPFVGPRFTKMYRNICQRISFEEVKARYPSLFAGLSESGRATAGEVAAFYGSDNVRLDDDTSPPFNGLSNQEKMHSRIESSVDFALQSGLEFDFLIRIRPDLPMRAIAFDWTDLGRICRAAPTVFADHAAGVHYADLLIGDQFALSTPDVMKIYAQTWTLYPKMAKHGLLRCSVEFRGHTSLAQVCWIHGIAVKRVPIRFGQLQEAEPLSSRTILGYLSEDAVGRMDQIDTDLIAAISHDLRP